MNEFIRVMKALSDGDRVKIVKMLQHRSLCSCEIQAALGISELTTAGHLKNLEEAGLIWSQKEGQWVNYYLADGSKSPYAALMLASLEHWLNDDKGISDLMTALRFIHRDNICKK